MVCELFTGFALGAFVTTQAIYRYEHLSMPQPKIGTPTLVLLPTLTTTTTTTTMSSAGPTSFLWMMICLGLLALAPLYTHLLTTAPIIADNAELRLVVEAYEKIIESLQYKFQCMNVAARACDMKADGKAGDVEELSKEYRRVIWLYRLALMVMDDFGYKDEVLAEMRSMGADTRA